MNKSIQAEALALLATIDGQDGGWDESMFADMDDAAQDDAYIAEVVANIRHHMNGTDDVRGRVERQLRELSANK